MNTVHARRRGSKPDRRRALELLASRLAVRRVNELDFYSLGLRDLARKLRVKETRLLWLIQREGMQEDPDFFKVIKIGRALRAKLAEIDLDALWANRKAAA
jgi:hypothetical protein